MLQETNCLDYTWEDLDMAKNGNPKEKNWMSVNSSTKYSHREQLYKRKKVIIRNRIASVSYVETEMRELIK